MGRKKLVVTIFRVVKMTDGHRRTTKPKRYLLIKPMMARP
jgi:hypothetical protein